jgi:4-alpha-glucanotransferase
MKELANSYLNKIIELTKEQIERQDFVDNAIFELLQTVNPTDNNFDWDIEMIGDLRDAIQYQIIKKTNCSEQDFYPYIEE